MEVLESRTNYFECELDPNEFRKDPNQKKTSGFSFSELPYQLFAILLTMLYYVVTPMTVAQTYSRVRK